MLFKALKSFAQAEAAARAAAAEILMVRCRSLARWELQR